MIPGKKGAAPQGAQNNMMGHRNLMERGKGGFFPYGVPKGLGMPKPRATTWKAQTAKETTQKGQGKSVKDGKGTKTVRSIGFQV